MSKKQKYRISDRFVETFDGQDVCEAIDEKTARKIARALNSMEAKPKAKPFKFDWKRIHDSWKFAAVDKSGYWRLFVTKPEPGVKSWEGGFSCRVERPMFPGDWRDSLQKRP